MNPLASKRILIVDDSPIVRERLVSLLSDIQGVEIVGETDNAQQALVLISALKPSIVILDLSMPGGSGLAVLDTLQKSPPAPLIIVLTNYAHDLYRRKCLNLGADYFFDKSTEFEEVKYLLEKLPLPAGSWVAPATVPEP